MQKITVDEIVAKYKRPIVVDANGCWNWLGSISTQGYGIYNGKPVYGLVFRAIGGICKPPMVLRHQCANKRCINPNHLLVGTYSENLCDSILDGTHGKVGVAGYRKMVELHANGARQVDIAKHMNVSRSLVSMFFLGRLMNFKPEDFIGGGNA